MILSEEDLARITGFKARARQIKALERERIPFRVNARGHVIVAASAALRWLGVDSDVRAKAPASEEPDFSAFDR